MRGALFSILAAGALYAGAATPAAAIDYPYCAQGRGVGIPGDCSYATYDQCLASASGRNLSCNINPRVAFARGGYGGQQGYGPQYGYGQQYGYGPQPRYRERRPPPGYYGGW